MTDDLELHIIKLLKIRNDKANVKEVTSYMEKNESMKKAKEKLNTMSEDETIRRLAELREKAILDELEVKAYNYKKGKNDGLAQGREEGLKQKNKEIAKKMKEKGFSIDDITEITNLSKSEIEEL